MEEDHETADHPDARHRGDTPPAERAGSSSGRSRLGRAGDLATDPVIEAYKRGIDRTLLRQNLRRSVTERVANLIALQRLAAEARRAGGVPRKKP